MELGFVGLGQMGKPIALNLLKGGGADLIALARRNERLAEFRGRGARGRARNPETSQAQTSCSATPASGAWRCRRWRRVHRHGLEAVQHRCPRFRTRAGQGASTCA